MIRVGCRLLCGAGLSWLGVLLHPGTGKVLQWGLFPGGSGVFMKQLKKRKAAALALDTAARVDVFEAIRQGRKDVANGRTQPLRKVFDELRRRHDIPR